MFIPAIARSSLSSVLRYRLRGRGLALTALGLVISACGGSGSTRDGERTSGQSEFTSAAPSGGQGRGLATGDAARAGGPVAPGAATAVGTATPRTVEETDLYRLEGDRLYYLNGFRGLMVFDVSNVDQPKLLGRSAIYGSPVEMIVRNGIASVVVADWYGAMDDGTPFHGSIVRGIDATDPTNMRILGEAKLGGWVRDTRVVGDVIYAVTEQYPWDYGWYGRGLAGGAAVSTSSSLASVRVTSVNIAGGHVLPAASYDVPGQGGIFHVTAQSILLASELVGPADQYGYSQPTGVTELRYLDISDPQGQIGVRGALQFPGSMQGWSADNGRWNLDFADGKLAHALACNAQYCGSGQGLVLATADFSNPDQPTLESTLSMAGSSWAPTARFDSGRMYLSPGNGYGCWYNGTNVSSTPLDVYDLSNPKAPVHVGSTQVDGQVWLFMPSGDRLFALGDACVPTNQNYYGSNVSLRYLDVSDATKPTLLGSASFGDGWAWTPAAGTFKAFTKSDPQGLVVLPFAGWSAKDYSYNNGLQLIEFTPSGIQTSGAAHTKGWVERGIFVGNRLVSLSDLSLAVVDYTDRVNPTVVAELTLARNVVDVKPKGATVAELSSDWWDNDQDHSTLRILPADQAEENVADATLASLDIAGFNAQIFHNGDLSYVVSNVRHDVPCSSINAPSGSGKDGTDTCQVWTQRVAVVDRADGKAVTRGSVELPNMGGYYYGGWGWYGCDVWSWYYGSDVVQVSGDALAFRRWSPQYDASGQYVDGLESLFVVDLKNPDSPAVSSLAITEDPAGFWGNMRAVGAELYASHYEWIEQGSNVNGGYTPGTVRYFLDAVDLSDRAHPRVGRKINVPGFLVGASETDPSLIYTMDYRWWGNSSRNELDVLKVVGDKAFLQGRLEIPGWVGSTFVRGDTAYFTVQHEYDSVTNQTQMELYQVDLSNPASPVVLPTPAGQGWGWLLGVEGDRAIVSSGWGFNGVDIFKLTPGAAPKFDQFVRTRGWGASSLARQGNDLFLASGYWGTQRITLQ